MCLHRVVDIQFCKNRTSFSYVSALRQSSTEMDLTSVEVNLMIARIMKNRIFQRFDHSVLFFLIAVDTLCLLGDVLSNNPLFSLQRDRNYPEHFQYLKFVWIAVSLIYCSLTRGKRFLLLLSAVPVYLLVDDYRGLHEKCGNYIAVNILGASDPSAAILHNTSFRAQDVGELLYMASMAVLIYCFTIISYLSAKEKKDKQFILTTILTITMFGLFAVFIDGVHQLFDHKTINIWLGRVEDFGEMIAVSAWSALAYKYSRKSSKTKLL